MQKWPVITIRISLSVDRNGQQQPPAAIISLQVFTAAQHVAVASATSTLQHQCAINCKTCITLRRKRQGSSFALPFTITSHCSLLPHSCPVLHCCAWAGVGAGAGACSGLVIMTINFVWKQRYDSLHRSSPRFPNQNQLLHSTVSTHSVYIHAVATKLIDAQTVVLGSLCAAH